MITVSLFLLAIAYIVLKMANPVGYQVKMITRRLEVGLSLDV